MLPISNTKNVLLFYILQKTMIKVIENGDAPVLGPMRSCEKGACGFIVNNSG